MRTFVVITLLLSANAQVPVSPAGSYAAEIPINSPSRSEGAYFGRTTNQIDELYENLFISAEKKEGSAIPTNSWWGDILYGDRSYVNNETGERITHQDPFGGQLWFYPGVTTASSGGLHLYIPDTWAGENMALNSPLTISGNIPPTITESTLLDSFEEEEFSDNWTGTGYLSSTGPQSQADISSFTISNIQGGRHLNTFGQTYGAYSAIGTLTRTYTITKDALDFLVGGGNEDQETYVSLSVGEVELLKVHGNNSPDMNWARCDTSDYIGQEATITIVDNSTETWGFICADHFIETNESEVPETLYSTSFTPNATIVQDWGDWHLDYSLEDATGRGYDITVMRGSPAVWLSPQGDLTPKIWSIQGQTWRNADGSEVTFPTTETELLIMHDGERRYALCVPPQTELFFDISGALNISLPESTPHFVFLLLNSSHDIPALASHAWGLPEESTLSWEYSPEEAEVVTTHTVSTKHLLNQTVGTSTLLGWIPHHYDAGNLNATLTEGSSTTPRGELRISTGNSGTITYDFRGLLPSLPIGDLDPVISASFLEGYDLNNELSHPDTYWGGKALLRLVKHLQIAEVYDTDLAEELLTSIKTRFTDWFTYSGEDDPRYFARYPNMRALVGYPFSYGSQAFNDHHFHYGYFTTAIAILAQQDPDFVQQYGGFATLVAKEYANWDRQDSDFPVFRNFDPWEGHSWAGGVSSYNGQNQESTSEAIQSWVGLFLLGSAIGDDAMRDAGAMGYTLETAATSEYWYRSGGNFPDSYDKEIVGILRANGLSYGTFFGDNPAWISGIQWTPANIWWDFILEDDPTYANTLLTDVDNERIIDDLLPGMVNYGGVWTHYALNLLGLSDPASAMEYWETHADADVFDQDLNQRLLTYSRLTSYETYGTRDFSAHTSAPTSAIYKNQEDGMSRYIITNTTTVEQTYTLYADGEPIGTVTVPAGETSTGTLENFSQWKSFHYPDTSKTETELLREYAYGNEALSAPVINRQGEVESITAPQMNLRDDIIYKLQRSTDLSNWENIERLPNINELTYPEQDHTPKCFYRFHAEDPSSVDN